VKKIVAVNGSIPANPVIETIGTEDTWPTGVALDGSGNLFVSFGVGQSSVEEIMAADGYATIKTLGSGFSNPLSVAVDRDENVFVTDAIGALHELVAAGDYATVKTFLGILFSAVTVDAGGNVLVAKDSIVGEFKSSGGDFGPVNVGGSSTTPVAMLFIFDAPVTLGSTAVLTKGAANLDFTDAGTGTCTANTTYYIGDTCTVNVTFKPKYPGPRYGAAELFDTSGKLLATGYVQGTGVGPLATFAKSTSGIYLPGKQVSMGSGLNDPVGVAVDGSGNVFVADRRNNAVKEILAAGGYLTVKAVGSGFSSPNGVAVDGAGNLFVCDSGNHKVKELMPVGGYTTIKTLGSGFNGPAGLSVDGSGNLFIADWDASAIYELVAADGYTALKSLGSGFYHPDDAAVDGSGNVFVSDFGHNAVKEILAAGGYTTVHTLGSGFNGPGAVAVDASDNVYVADESHSAVKEIVAAGGYATVNTLGNWFYTPAGLAMDGSGNFFVVENGANKVTKADYVDPPSLNFAGTSAGVQSSDSPQTVTVFNNGNADLAFPVPVSGDNPALSSANFALDVLTTCPQVNASSSADGTLAGGASCDYAVDFTPVKGGSDSGSLTLADNSLNAGPMATQTIPLTGITIGPRLAFTTPPPANLSPGRGPGTVAVSIEDSSNNVISTSNATVKLSVTGPNSYSKVYTATAASGVATFSSLAVLSTAGSYTYTATDTADGLTQAVANESVTWPPPVGYLGQAADSVSLGATVGQPDSLKVQGWVADLQDGAPLSSVTVYVDGTSIGKPTMGISRADVAAKYGSAFLNSGFKLVYPASSFSLGKHKVTVVAVDSGGRSTTLGPRTITVVATAASGPPFGNIGEAVDSVTGTTTVSQSHSLKVVGWVADPADGAPLANVKVYVDGVSIGTPTLGIARPDVAAKYGNAYLNSGYRMVYPASSLTVGTHKVTVVAVDAGGRSTTFGPLAITVQ
jgi:sugar lactone lactonase YvrE